MIKIAACALLLLAASLAQATDLRGRVEVRHPYTKMIYPRGGIAVHLAAPGRPQTPLRRVFSGPDGMYFLPGVPPGNYVLVVNNSQFPLSVRPLPVQDIQPIQVPS
jgi:hypothetical protein